MSAARHGSNIRHGYVKLCGHRQAGDRVEPMVFPALIGRARRSVAEAIGRAETVRAAGAQQLSTVAATGATWQAHAR
jgi:hypothetical protein